MYKILTKASIDNITGFHWCASICDQFANLPQSTSPNSSNIKYLHQTNQCANGMCYKRGFLCCWRERHFEDSMLPPSLICCSDKITAVLRKNNYYFCCFRVSQNATYNLLRMCASNYTLLENYLYIPCVPNLSTMWD